MLRLLKQPPADSGNNRIMRGFWRLGAASALIVIVAGGLASIIGPGKYYFDVADERSMLGCLHERAKARELVAGTSAPNQVDIAASGCKSVSYHYITLNDVRKFDPTSPNPAVSQTFTYAVGGLAFTMLLPHWFTG